MTRIYHTWDKWECYRAGFHNNKPDFDATTEEIEVMFANYFKVLSCFEHGINRVFKEWPNSCEHNLTNENLNRIAWLGQAAACIDLGIPARYRSGYRLLTEAQQNAANDLALNYINQWMVNNGYEVTDGSCKHKGANQY